MKANLEQQISKCLLKDRFRLRRRLRQLQSRNDERAKSERETVRKLIDKSIEIREFRERNRPDAKLADDLPITAHADEIVSAIQERQVIVIAGETGSGKSTQLPKLCLQAGYGVSGMIGHTQPRRIAARTVAARIADEMRVAGGTEVGFKIRFTDKTDDRTYIKLMTDGILLAETQTDRFLENYEVIILDEAHERSLNIDFLIGYLHGLRRKRRDLRVVITSATLDADRFAEHFADNAGAAPIIKVSGRSYPVEVRYRPLAEDDQDPTDVFDAIAAAVRELSQEGNGDILVFLPTERDIREAAKRLRSDSAIKSHGSTAILPLYARLSTAEQNRIFQTGKQRRIVLATNVAESSLTVPGIRYVIDTGTARVSRYSPRLKVQRLPIESISQASAEQRKGRCGRVAPGICIRLYGEEDFESRDAYTTPEIRRTNLASVILQAKSLRLGAIDQIPFLDPPRHEAIRDGHKTLFELGAIDDKRELTRIGKRLAKLPVDPRIGRMILEAEKEGCLAETLVIASALEVQDPRERPQDKQQAADQQHEKFRDEESDFVGFLNLWDFFHKQKENLSRSKLRKACQQNFLSHNRMHEWQEIYRQLQRIVRDNRMTISSKRDDYAAIHRSLLCGLLSGVALRTSEVEYTGAGGVKFYLWPGSGLFQKRPQWVMAAEIVETSRRYGRIVARINPNWIEPLAAHLTKHSYNDPHWHIKSETVMAHEKVTLYGVPIVARRRARYGSIDSTTARQIFIQHALVERKLRSPFHFMQHNEKVLADIDELAKKTRKRAFLVDEYSLFDFYNRRLPDGIYDADSLRRWLRPKKQERDAQLCMSIEDLSVAPPANAIDEFPNEMKIGSIKAPLRYNFSPGDNDDGVTVTVPIEGLNQLDAAVAGWVVPGLVEEKVAALIRSLPKPIRRGLVPVPERAKEVAECLEFGHGNFFEETSKLLGQIAEEPISPSDFRLDELPEHLQLNIEVMDHDGELKVAGRDLEQLREQLSGQEIEAAPVQDDAWHRDRLTKWDFDLLPSEIVVRRGSMDVPMYPAISDGGEFACLRLMTTLESARHQTRFGLMRLLSIAKRKSLRSQVRWLPGLDKAKVHAARWIDPKSLEQQLADAISLLAIDSLDGKIETRSAFEQFVEQSGEAIAVATQEFAPIVSDLFGNLHQARLSIEKAGAARWKNAVDDIRRQLDNLITHRFLVETPFRWLIHFPRFLHAIEMRIEKLKSGGFPNEETRMQELADLWNRYAEKRERHEQAGIVDVELEEFRWMIEEYRVSLFAQSLGTFVKVSPQRLEKQWAKVR